MEAASAEPLEAASAAGPTARDDEIRAGRGGDELRQLASVDLEVGRQRHEARAVGIREAHHQRGCFAEALAQPDDLERLARFAHRLELAASIPIAVEDVDHLITRAARIEPLSVLAMQRRKIVDALTDGHA